MSAVLKLDGDGANRGGMDIDAVVNAAREIWGIIQRSLTETGYINTPEGANRSEQLNDMLAQLNVLDALQKGKIYQSERTDIQVLVDQEIKNFFNSLSDFGTKVHKESMSYRGNHASIMQGKINANVIDIQTQCPLMDNTPAEEPIMKFVPKSILQNNSLARELFHPTITKEIFDKRLGEIRVFLSKFYLTQSLKYVLNIYGNDSEKQNKVMAELESRRAIIRKELHEIQDWLEKNIAPQDMNPEQIALFTTELGENNDIKERHINNPVKTRSIDLESGLNLSRFSRASNEDIYIGPNEELQIITPVFADLRITDMLDSVNGVSKIAFRFKQKHTSTWESRTGYIRDMPHTGFAFEIFENSDDKSRFKNFPVVSLQKIQKEIASPTQTQKPLQSIRDRLRTSLGSITNTVKSTINTTLSRFR